jgi:hypothetical protein
MPSRSPSKLSRISDVGAGVVVAKCEGRHDMSDAVDYTPEQLSALQKLLSGYGEQSESGVDISLLRANLRLTPLERLAKLQDSARFIERLRHASRPGETT